MGQDFFDIPEMSSFHILARMDRHSYFVAVFKLRYQVIPFVFIHTEIKDNMSIGVMELLNE